MRKRTTEEWKKKVIVLFLIGIVMICILMVAGFERYSEDIHRMVLEREMEQAEQTSHYITQMVRKELRECITVLETIGETIYYQGEEALQENLQQVMENTQFVEIGVLATDGKNLDNNGHKHRFESNEIKRALRENKTYISDVMLDGSREKGQILIVVPFGKDDTIEGAVWGRYPIAEITRRIDEIGGEDSYFQVIDSEGRYLSRSESENAFAKGIFFWDEMEKYEYLDGSSVEQIKASVERQESGEFHFRYQGKTRYVSYEPLNVNNWYVFSVLVGDILDGYAQEIRTRSERIALAMGAFLTILFASVLFIFYKGSKTVEKANHELMIKTRLFEMIMGRTKDIPVEIGQKGKWMKLYRANGEQQDYDILYDFSPELLLSEELIRKEGYEGYSRVYHQIMNGQEADTLVLEINLDGRWSWKKLHLYAEKDHTVIGFLEDYEEQMEQKMRIEEIRKRIRYDVLTGLYNRDTFIKEVEAAIQNDGFEQMSALFLLDLDHFKEVNDSFGHIMGDQALRDAAQRIKGSIRNSDLAGRLGGDEFVLFIRGVGSMEGFHKCARKLNEILRWEYEADGIRVEVSASIGIAIVKPGQAFLQIYKNADVALYEVKRAGRNSYRISEE